MPWLNDPRAHAGIAALVMASLFGGLLALPQMQSAADDRARRYILIGYVLGALYNGAAGLFFYAVGAKWLADIGFSDGWAVGAFLGVATLPLTPILLKRLGKRAEGGSGD